MATAWPSPRETLDELGHSSPISFRVRRNGVVVVATTNDDEPLGFLHRSKERSPISYGHDTVVVTMQDERWDRRCQATQKFGCVESITRQAREEREQRRIPQERLRVWKSRFENQAIGLADGCGVRRHDHAERTTPVNDRNARRRVLPE